MSRYIDADALINDLIRNRSFYPALVASAIKNTPTADVVEVRHGKWIYHECVSSYDGLQSGYSCSACNAFVDEEIFDLEEYHKDFCGNCGAKMDGERSENDT